MWESHVVYMYYMHAYMYVYYIYTTCYMHVDVLVNSCMCAYCLRTFLTDKILIDG